jgi:hypothetical protein
MERGTRQRIVTPVRAPGGQLGRRVQIPSGGRLPDRHGMHVVECAGSAGSSVAVACFGVRESTMAPLAPAGFLQATRYSSIVPGLSL